MKAPIPFNRARLVGNEHAYIDEAMQKGKLSGNGDFALRCASELEKRIGAKRALITPSCTAALEMAGILAGLDPGDEVVLPSFTFVSTANAFAMRGAVPFFADVEPGTLNLDPDALAAAITPRTKVVVVVHYAGVACRMERILELVERHRLFLIEDAAHSLPAFWRGKPVGSLGHVSTFSFHETKNVHCGEGGALLINDEALVERAEIVQEKGTDRSRFFRGQTDKYTWQDIGSSYLLSEVSTAFLAAQLERLDEITAERQQVWSSYHQGFADLEERGMLRRPVIPPDCEHSAHLYYLLMEDERVRDELIERLRSDGIMAVFHYTPLHNSPAGLRLGRASGELTVTLSASSRLLRLPIWSGIRDRQVSRIIDSVCEHVLEISSPRSLSR
jgi:dTDP-4-amino-4,6-dideoxygalactose transaminase